MKLKSRYRRITFFFARAIASVVYWDLILPRIGLREHARRTRPGRMRTLAARFRELAIEMGGVMIKLGQFLSSRADVLPPEITSELAGLQDEVPAEPFEDIRRVIEQEYRAPITTRFKQFAREPIAAASLGQAHRAILNDEDSRQAGFSKVVVKVQRPNIDQLINTDLAAIRRVAGWLQKYPPISRRADVPALYQEFAKTLYEEIDYQAEAKNAETFAKNLGNLPHVYIPKVVWEHSTERVLVLEDVTAIKISDHEAIAAAGIDRTAVAKRLFNTYLQQIFRDGFFHADPHPGNLFITPVLPEDPRDPENTGWVLTFIDFGMVGHVPPDVKAGLREMVIGVGTRDAARVVKSYQMLGVLLPGADLEKIEQAEAEIFDRFWGKSMKELRQIDYREMREFARQYRDLLYEMPFQIPSDMLYLGRCVAILSGMCTSLDPDFDVWRGLAPFAQELIAEDADDIWNEALEQVFTWGKLVINLPQRLDTTLTKLERGKLSLRNPDLERRLTQVERSNRKLAGAVIFAALLLGGIQLTLGGALFLGGATLALAAFSLGWVILTR